MTMDEPRMTADDLPPLTDDDRAIIELAREHAPVVYTNRHFPDTPAFSFPTRKLLDFARAYAAAAVAMERESNAAELDEASFALLRGRRRVNQVDRHVADVLQRYAASIRSGAQSPDTGSPPAPPASGLAP